MGKYKKIVINGNIYKLGNTILTELNKFFNNDLIAISIKDSKGIILSPMYDTVNHFKKGFKDNDYRVIDIKKDHIGIKLIIEYRQDKEGRKNDNR